MNQEVINQLFQFVLIPLLIVLTRFVVKWFDAKSAEIQSKTDSETAKKYIEMFEQTVTSCVIATNQTYVDSLKKQGKFDAAAQEMAFQLTKEAIMEILSAEAKKYLTEIYGDLEKYMTSKIESEVKLNKAV